jgi:hypothetical protein
VAQAIAWARDRGLPGVMLETQSVNVAACRLYERCGFVLGGFDACLYRSVMTGTHKSALFWYLVPGIGCVWGLRQLPSSVRSLMKSWRTCSCSVGGRVCSGSRT